MHASHGQKRTLSLFLLVFSIKYMNFLLFSCSLCLSWHKESTNHIETVHRDSRDNFMPIQLNVSYLEWEVERYTVIVGIDYPEKETVSWGHNRQSPKFESFFSEEKGKGQASKIQQQIRDKEEKKMHVHISEEIIKRGVDKLFLSLWLERHHHLFLHQQEVFNRDRNDHCVLLWWVTVPWDKRMRKGNSKTYPHLVSDQ
jgi:hypothetical protein